MSPQSLRARFTDGGLETASPARVVVLAYDRLDRDLAGALVAIEARQIERSHELLVHAQDLVHELLCMLDLDAWEHAVQLASIYQYVIDLLTTANVRKRAKEINEARMLLAGLGDAFRQAAVSPAVPAAPAAPRVSPALAAPVTRPVPAFAGADAAPRQFSARA
jgi:flagellar secretion chaperone FliS